jgi:ribosomal protein S18 acetylase RimI-like enzyme
LGRHLLQRSLQEMHRIGYRNASISTDWENHRALLFYSNHGFNVVDWTYCYGRDLS